VNSLRALSGTSAINVHGVNLFIGHLLRLFQPVDATIDLISPSAKSCEMFLKRHSNLIQSGTILRQLITQGREPYYSNNR
jgi:hypothetical protein